VRGIIKRYEINGTVENLPGRGKKRAFTPREHRNLVRKIKINPKISSTQLAEEMKQETGKSVTSKTIRNDLKREGYTSHYCRKKPDLKKIHRLKRLQFAEAHVEKPQQFWDSVLWSDESKFTIYKSDGRQRAFMKPKSALNPKNVQSTVKHGGGKVMVWGSMATNGTGNMQFIDVTMDQQYYQELVSANVKESARKLGLGRNFTFQQDNDPKHTAKKTFALFKQEKIKVLDWPSQSPDLNPIEHLWEHMDRMIRKTKITSTAMLREEIMSAWATVSPDVTRNLVHSMRRRLLAVIKAKGGHTKY